MNRSWAESDESAGIISRRALVLGGGQLALLGTLVLRTRQLQVHEAANYQLLAEDNRVNVRLISPRRGKIFDRHGIPVAENGQNYRIVIVREDAGDVDETIAKVRRLVVLDESKLERALKEMYRRSPFVPVTLADQLAWEDVAEVAVNAPALPGITPEVGLSRVYPLGSDFAHVVGYVGPVSESDLSRVEPPDPVLQIPGYQFGKVGIEARRETDLRGRAGLRRIEVSAAGRVMRELGRDASVPGSDLQLTVDHALQNYALARLAGESGSAVVIDVETGGLRAMVSSPSFDPNLFVRGISVKDYGALRDHALVPLFNRSVQGQYPPGSTFKMMTALAALRAGVLGPRDTIHCPGHLDFGGRKFHCWRSGGHGRMDLDMAIAQSCDVYFYEAARRVGIDRIAELCAEFGLGQRPDIPVSAVRSGLVPSIKWKARVRGEGWLQGETLNAGIGQGDVLASPLQLAVMTARIAGMRAVKPRLIKSVDGVEAPVEPVAEVDVPEGLMQLVRRAMYNVVNGPRGTARNARIVAEEFLMAGKTGTSQVRSISETERDRGVTKNEELPRHLRDHGLFVAFAPYDKPKYAIAVVIEHGGSGALVALPARDILLYALSGGIPPLTAYPPDQREAIRQQHREMVLRPRQKPVREASRA
ncbi:MAG: penicillin-binding protein 2 [Boseongicola sp. SB0670_bin_30]|nr:penicillin-binding protein 2 [Boseongicola sp. SB0670_bin_30]